jgi:chromosome segregation ATPase
LLVCLLVNLFVILKGKHIQEIQNQFAMRPVEFTAAEIVKAGQELQAVGRNVTGFAIRQKIGGGNPSRLKQVWDEHLASQVEAKAEPVAELPGEVAEEVGSISKELIDRLQAFAVEINDKAVKASERRVAEVIRTTGEQREQAERELADAAATVEELEGKLDSAEQRADELEGQLAELQGKHQEQAIELATLRERLTLIEAERNRYEEEAKQMREERDTARIEAATKAGEVKALQEQRQVPAGGEQDGGEARGKKKRPE